MLKGKFARNIGWIFIGNLVHAVLQFLLNIYVARAFSTDAYGLINYSASLITFFSSIGTLGFNGIITKKFAEDEAHSGEYLGTAMLARAAFSLASILFLQIIVHASNTEEKLLPIIVLCQSASILFASFDLPIYWFRYKSKAKTVAIIRLISFAISAVWRIVVVSLYADIVLYVIGVSLETCLFVVMLFVTYKNQNRGACIRFSCAKLASMFKISYPFISSAILSTIYGQTDKIMLKSMVDNTAVAIYSVSLTLAGAIVIIPTALIEGFRPDILSFKLANQTMYIKRLKQLYASVFWICVAYCIFITVSAKWIILLLYGNKYIDAVPSLSLVVWYTSFSYFGAINNLYMVAEEKTKWVQLTTLVGAITNVVLNFVLIPIYGVAGAAAASLVTQVFANFILLLIIPPLRENFFIICDAIMLRGIIKTNKLS